MEKCQRELAALPPPPNIEAPTAEILSMINEFTQKLNSTLHGSNEYKKTVQENRKSYDKFMRAIRATAPNFIPREKFTYRAEGEHEDENEGEANGVDDCDSDFENDEAVPMYLRDVQQIIEG